MAYNFFSCLKLKNKIPTRSIQDHYLVALNFNSSNRLKNVRDREADCSRWSVKFQIKNFFSEEISFI